MKLYRLEVYMGRWTPFGDWVPNLWIPELQRWL